ncbi:hypothetical protein OC844_002619 [Tilletia horrida]|nr:hypothetical protein OC844_002619 [Tilletia horrida]
MERGADEDFQYEPARKKFKCLPCTAFDLPTFVEKRHMSAHARTHKHQAHKSRRASKTPLSERPSNVPEVATGGAELAEDVDDSELIAVPEPQSPLGQEFLLPVPRAEREQARMWAIAEASDDEVADVVQDEIDAANRDLDRIVRSAWDGLQDLAEDVPGGWYPFQKKDTAIAMFLWLSPRFAVSKRLMGLMLTVAKIFNGTPPTLYACERDLATARKAFNSQPREVLTDEGKRFFARSIFEMLANDFASPSTRKKMNLFPRRGRHLADVRDGAAMCMTEDTRTTPPMALHGDRQFWTKELHLLPDKRIMLAHTFFEDDQKVMWCEGRVVKERGTRLVVGKELIIISLSDIVINDRELRRLSRLDLYHGNEAIPHINPLREAAAGKRAYSVPIALFIDDLSGNRSKRWNKHEAIYMSNLCLDRDALDLDAHTHFVSISTRVGAVDQAEAVVNELIDAYRNPQMLYDCEAEDNVLIRPYLLLLLADNPMAADLTGSIGLKGNLFCRMCNVDASKADTEAGVRDYLAPADPRSSPGIIASLREQITTAAKGVKARVDEMKTASGVKDDLCDKAVARLLQIARISTSAQTEAEQRHILDGRWHGPFLRLYDVYGFDVAYNTPVEVLHTWLLGPAKYLWVHTCKGSEAKKELLAVRLSAICTRTFSDAQHLNGSYLVQNAGGLVGKDIKLISQAAATAFVPLRADGTISSALWEAWRWAGVITRLLFAERVSKASFHTYKADIGRALNNFYYCIACMDSSSIVSKRKFHILSHAAESIEAFGPAKGTATERYEAYNTITRNASLCSNKSAPSKDIAQRLTDQDMLRQVIGGTNCFTDSKGSRQSASSVAQNTSATLADGLLLDHYGMRKRNRHQAAGTVTKWKDERILSLANGDRVRKGDAVLISRALMEGGNEDFYNTQTMLVHIESVQEQDEDQPIPAPAMWIRGSASGSYVAVRGFFPVRLEEVDPSVDNLRRFQHGNEIRNVPVSGVLDAIHFVHDCAYHKCPIIRTVGAREERAPSQAVNKVVRHSIAGQQTFILNDAFTRSSMLSAIYGSVAQRHTSEEAAAKAMETRGQ